MFIAMSVIACLASQPKSCETFKLPNPAAAQYGKVSDPIVVGGASASTCASAQVQEEVMDWVHSHPGYEVKSFICQTANQAPNTKI